MSDDRPAVGSSRFEVRTTADSHFAWLRTRLAVENTMLAYLRTAASLIGFGFGVLQGEQKTRPLHAGSFVLILVGLFAFFAVLLRIG